MRVVFDTNIFIKYRLPRDLRGMLLSAVVLHELVAGAGDKSEVQFAQAMRDDFEKENRLITPTLEDWWEAGRVLHALRQGLKSRAKGITPKLSPDEVQRIFRDVMIARTARRARAAVVTDNIGDFLKIKPFCNVRVIPGADFFDN